MNRLVAPLALVALMTVPAFAADADNAVVTEAPAKIVWTGAPVAASAEAITIAPIARSLSRPTVLTSMYVGLVALQGYDVYSTHTALKLGAVETNPVFAGKMANPAVQIAVKGAVTAFSIYTAEKLWKRKHRVAAVALMAATNALMAMVAANNASVIRGQR